MVQFAAAKCYIRLKVVRKEQTKRTHSHTINVQFSQYKPSTFFISIPKMDTKILLDRTGTEMLMFILSHPLQQLPCPFLVFRLQKPVFANASHELGYTPFVLFSTGFIADKNVSGSFACIFFSLDSIVCVLVWDRHKSAGKMKATKCCAMLSSRMHESKD